MDFMKIKTPVAAKFAAMAKSGAVFRVELDKDILYSTYLDSFPEGTNNMYRERREYDCSCCRSFIKSVGNMVTVDGQGNIDSIWNVKIKDEPNFQPVVDALHKFVVSHAISEAFFSSEPTAGVDRNHEQREDGTVIQWDHFFVNIPRELVLKDSGTKRSEILARHDVLLRGANELTDDAINTVLDLINQNSLYRGQEHKDNVVKFEGARKVLRAITDEVKRSHLAWKLAVELRPSVSMLRNSSIGTLLQDLSNGRDIEGAVNSFEAMVAPTNYRRPTAIVTPKMIEQAKAKVEELGLTSALRRRYANLSDITVNNILFADRSARKVITGDEDVFDTLSSSAKVQDFNKIEEVSIEKFISDILPTASNLEVYLERRHKPNLVSLITSVDPTCANLFKWSNNFTWSYVGDVADSIKEKVKAAGGNVTGDVCCRLAWYNHDDLDFHMEEPVDHIYFGAKTSRSTGGRLDVDMNAGCGTTREPVENIFYSKITNMVKGNYNLNVRQFSKRETTDVGFDVEIDVLGTVHHFSHPQAVPSGAYINVATLVSDGKGNIQVIPGPGVSSSKGVSNGKTENIWGLDSGDFHRANVVMMSPNFWDDQVGIGNKHYFFMLDQMKNEGTARGFFNEYLKPELDAHRKVLELVGSKMKTEETNDQLSGLGFSSTSRNDLIVRVTGKSLKRVIKIRF